MRTSVRVGRGDDPARRPRRVLRVGRAAGRPAPSRPSGDRRRRGGAGRQLRGQGVRRPHRDGRGPGPPAVPAGDRRAAADVGLHRGQQGGVRGVRATPRRWSRACRSTRRSSTSAGCSGSPARRSRSPPASAATCCEQVGLPITVGVARTKFLAKVASGVAKPDGLLVVPPDARARVPAPAAGGAALGRRAGDRRASCTTAASRRSARSRRLGEAALVAMLGPRVRPAPPRAGAQPRSAAGAGRAGGGGSIGAQRALGPLAAIGRRARRHRWSALVDRVTRRMRAGRPGRPHRRAAAALRRLHPGHPVAHAAARDRAHPDDPRRGPGAARDGAPRDRSARAHAGRHRGRQPRRRRRRAARRCRSTGARRARSTSALDEVRDRFGRQRHHPGRAARSRPRAGRCRCCPD